MLPPDAAPIHTFVPSVLWLGDEPEAYADPVASVAANANMHATKAVLFIFCTPSFWRAPLFRYAGFI